MSILSLRKFVPLELFRLLHLTSPLTTIAMAPKLPLSLLKLISIVLYTSNNFGERVVIVHYIVYNKLSEPLGWGHKGEVLA